MDVRIKRRAGKVMWIIMGIVLLAGSGLVIFQTTKRKTKKDGTKGY